jgi:hypothetical protein
VKRRPTGTGSGGNWVGATCRPTKRRFARTVRRRELAVPGTPVVTKRSITPGRRRSPSLGDSPMPVPKVARRDVAHKSERARTGLTGPHASTTRFAKASSSGPTDRGRHDEIALVTASDGLAIDQ